MIKASTSRSRGRGERRVPRIVFENSRGRTSTIPNFSLCDCLPRLVDISAAQTTYTRTNTHVHVHVHVRAHAHVRTSTCSDTGFLSRTACRRDGFPLPCGSINLARRFRSTLKYIKVARYIYTHYTPGISVALPRRTRFIRLMQANWTISRSLPETHEILRGLLRHREIDFRARVESERDTAVPFASRS